MGHNRRTTDAVIIVAFASGLVWAALRASWYSAALAAAVIIYTALTFGKPPAKFDPSKSGIQKWKERRRS
jgi:hypothetical protein